MYLFSFGLVIVCIHRKEYHMFVVAAVVCIFLFTLAGSNLFVAQYDADELSSMGVEDK
jgi:hypothetical protein